MGDLDDADRRRMADLASGVAHPYRIAILAGLKNGESLPEVADDVGTTRGTLQHHVEKLIDADLVYRRNGTFAVTPVGRYMLARVQEWRDDLAPAFDRLDAARDVAEEELEPARDVLDDDEYDRKLHKTTWENAADDIADLLDEDG